MKCYRYSHENTEINFFLVLSVDHTFYILLLADFRYSGRYLSVVVVCIIIIYTVSILACGLCGSRESSSSVLQLTCRPTLYVLHEAIKTIR